LGDAENGDGRWGAAHRPEFEGGEKGQRCDGWEWCSTHRTADDDDNEGGRLRQGNSAPVSGMTFDALQLRAGEGTAATDREARTTQRPIDTTHPARAIAAATDATPTAPHSSGTRRLLGRRRARYRRALPCLVPGVGGAAAHVRS
jgi:hypothetical protein